MATTRTQASAPLASREFNGEVLLDCLDELRAAQVQQRHLNDCAAALGGLAGHPVEDAANRLRSIAASRFGTLPALASLLVRWSKKLKSNADVPLLIAHFERLALASAALGAMRRAQERLPRGDS